MSTFIHSLRGQMSTPLNELGMVYRQGQKFNISVTLILFYVGR